MRPPFPYFGGKTGMAKRIVDLMPPHSTYIEPFFGSGAVFFAKHPSRHEIINDVDDEIVTFFQVLRERPDELERACLLSPYARTEYLEARDRTQFPDEIEKARAFWVRINQSFAKTAGTRCRPRRPPGHFRHRHLR